jgi:hypothetical protein
MDRPTMRGNRSTAEVAIGITRGTSPEGALKLIDHYLALAETRTSRDILLDMRTKWMTLDQTIGGAVADIGDPVCMHLTASMGDGCGACGISFTEVTEQWAVWGVPDGHAAPGWQPSA